ncbi:DUF1045 domain-containing protein [Afifella pfennigii]|uniref:DUF1045 domain-containing protein n=1 Tax=Afifella pfennigii TaxID=209897 RepID=UPI00047ACE8F|nr:DUF1045 domain-containing protein [Afifella pfennigii]
MRAALYFTPAGDHPLAKAATSWLGREVTSGQSSAQAAPRNIGAEQMAEITAEPRRYGFHATLKPPFSLAAGCDLAALEAALAGFCDGREGLPLGRLEIARIGPFFALVPEAPPPGLNDFAGEIVRAFDGFRAPLTAAEIERRRPQSLSEPQRAHLMRWGYPYVFEEFRFHMTLTGPVEEARRPVIERALAEHFAGALAHPLCLDSVSIFVEPETGEPFTQYRRRALKQAAQQVMPV